MTLLELTSAYAALAADRFPVKPHPLVEDKPGILASLFQPGSSFNASEHVVMLDLLNAVVNQGTGTGARLRIKTYGKTGTSQESRDALFVGFAGDLVVGVWIGNDDNSPIKGITGGGLPARIWRDFMGQAVKGAAPVAPVPVRKKPDPEGPVLPLDLPKIPDIPVDIENSQIGLDGDNGVRLQTDIGGVPLDIRLGKDGLDVREGDKRERR
jgi:penicillin-binding protein 1A